MKLVYLITDPTYYDLPLAVLNTLRECSEWLNVPRGTLKTAFRRHGKYRGKKYHVERVQIEK